ncbi:hypothetical protein SAMN04487888_11811 [Eubacterium callanderi]|nr:hypothetical protein SAMN04487888_11811 [Eubacterium callanderi]
MLFGKFKHSLDKLRFLTDPPEPKRPIGGGTPCFGEGFFM